MKVFKLIIIASLIFIGLSALIYVISQLQVKKYAVQVISEPVTSEDNGIGGFFKKRSVPTADSTPILMYHHIRNNPEPNNPLEVSLNVSPTNFAKQMSYLKEKNYQTVPLASLFSPQDDKTNKKRVVITFDDGYKDVIDNAYPILNELNFTATVFPIVNNIGKTWYLTWSDLWTLEAVGWEIGSHTLTHPDLPLASQEQAEKEIEQSKSQLEYKLKKPVVSFCYPAGRFNENILEFVREAGYARAVTTIYGKINQSDEELMLKRIRISGPDSLPTFINRLK